MGKAIGIDMTDEQLKIARKYQDIQMRKFGLDKSNIEFKKGYIEDLKALGIKDDSIDVVISNCVINLSPDKKSVFREIFRVLKSGGELYFSDVFASSRVPDELRNDKIVYGECLGGALYIEDFRRILYSIGCPDYRVVSKSKLTISNSQIKKKIGSIDFYSMTIRAFKLADLEDVCEDYGQIAIYKGTIPHHPHKFEFDDHHVFISKKPMLVCGNTALMLTNSRFSDHFSVAGDKVNHYGIFQCGPAPAKLDNDGSSSGGYCC